MEISMPEQRLAALTARARGVAAQISSLQSELSSLAREMDETRALGTTLRSWLAWQCGLTPTEASRVATLGERLPGLPKLADAFARGALSEGSMAALVRVATPENEERLLDISETATAGQLLTILRDLRTATRAAAPAPDPEPDEHLSTWTDDHGLWHCNAALRAEWGAQIDAALRAATQPDQDATRVTRPEALTRIAQHYLAGTADTNGVIPERFQVHVLVDANTADTSIDGIGAIHPTVAAQIIDEAAIRVILRRSGQPVTVTSPTRCATPRQLAALRARDRGCRFPGCGRTAYLQAHHIEERQHGGRTRLDNLVLLCSHHHRVLHRKQWKLAGNANDALRVVKPDRTCLHAAPQRPPPQPTNDPSTVAEQRHTGTHDNLDHWARDNLAAHLI